MYAYYALHELHWKPSEFIGLDINEKAAVIAFIDKKIKDDKETAKMA